MSAENIKAENRQGESHRLTQKETRQIVTPYAFHVAPDLYGTPLARPIKRGVAISFDLMLIAILSQSASFVLAGVAAVTFFRAGNRLKLKKRFNVARLGLRFVSATLLFVFALGIFNAFELDKLGGDSGEETLEEGEALSLSSVETVAAVAISAKYMLAAERLVNKVDEGQCAEPYNCWQTLGDEVVDALKEVSIPLTAGLKMLTAIVEVADEQLSDEQQSSLLRHWESDLSESLESSIENKESVAFKILDTVQSMENTPAKQVEAETKSDSKEPSVIAWVQGVMEDLGLGFGWAAFYFCIFTAWWQGQTPGKKLLGIKVIKLDGNEPNLWESFGRYGGYAAGFTTGLLGFLQIYWDPNRQAIQDKISETLVIDLRIAKTVFIRPEQNIEAEH